MITDINPWMAQLVDGLRVCFGSRLLFVGLQGSYNRGEATPDSDIDVVTIVDIINPDDLAAYKRVVAAMPEGDKACGFISGREEFAAWPAYEAFVLLEDTRAWYGAIEGIASWTDDDIRESVNIAASALYHQCCHTTLYADPEARAAVLDGMLKSSFFLARAYYRWTTGQSVLSLSELESRAALREREILRMAKDRKTPATEGGRDADACFRALMRWSSALLRESKA